MLHPDERPSLWRRTRNGYDAERVGPEIETSPSLLPEGDDAAACRRWFDTSRPGKSKTGHRFPDVLTAAEKRAVLEYLKTL